MILLGDAQTDRAEQMHVADAMLARKNCSSQELLERIKVMSARKRGPRKGAQRMPQDARSWLQLREKAWEYGTRASRIRHPHCSWLSSRACFRPSEPLLSFLFAVPWFLNACLVLLSS